jgi:hypothetical protein
MTCSGVQVVTKTCTICLEEKAVEHFGRLRRSRDGLNTRCRVCHLGYMAEYRDKNREAVREKHRRWQLANKEKVAKYKEGFKDAERSWKRNSKLRIRFGITLHDYERLLQEQGGVCAICRRAPADNTKQRALAVDHCHQTGTIRGLLCGPCNLALGLFQDKAEFLVMAAEYLDRERLKEAS